LLKKEAIEIDDEDKGEHWLLKEQTIKINDKGYDKGNNQPSCVVP